MSNKTMTPKLRFPEFREAGEWRKKALNQLLKIGNGKDYKHLTKGKIPVYGSGGYMLSVNDYLYEGESVCIGRKGTINKPMFLNEKFWVVDTLFYTHSFKDCLPKFIYLIFQNINWLDHNEAGGIPSLSKTSIEKIEVLIPKLPEQQKIATTLSSLDDLIAAQSQKIKALQTHKKGLMQLLFPAEGERTPRVRFGEFEHSGEWEEKTLGSICNSFSGGTPDTTRKDFYGGNIPFIRSAEINKEETELFLTENGFRNSSAKLVTKGDVLVALYGANSGDVALTKIDGAINQAILCLRSQDSNPFIYQFLSFKKDWVVSTFIQGGQGNLSGDIIKSIHLPFPKLAEQQKIAATLSSLDDLIGVQTQKLEALKAHKRGLMQQLFPNPNHETL